MSRTTSWLWIVKNFDFFHGLFFFFLVIFLSEFSKASSCLKALPTELSFRNFIETLGEQNKMEQLFFPKTKKYLV